MSITAERPRPMRPEFPAGDEPAELALTASPAAVDLLNDLARRTGDDPGRVLAKGLMLLKFAVDARDRGERVAILDSELEEITTEITGL